MGMKVKGQQSADRVPGHRVQFSEQRVMSESLHRSPIKLSSL